MLLALLILILAAQPPTKSMPVTTSIVVVGEKLPEVGDRPVLLLPGLSTQPANLLTFEQALEITRGNRLVLQSLRDKECVAQSRQSCGSDLPVRARRTLDTADDRAAAILVQLADVIDQSSSPAIPAAIVFASTGLAYRNAPKKQMEAVRDAIMRSGARFNIVAAADGAGLAGLKRLAEITGVTVTAAAPEAFGRLESEPPPVASALPERAAPLPAIVVGAVKHAADFAARAKTLLADEHNVQEIKTRPSSASIAAATALTGITIEKRILDSEVALVNMMNGGLWLMARDIVRIDGKPVPAAQRILLPAPHPGTQGEAVSEFRKIAAQGARFNIGDIQRDLNTPTLALWLLTPEVVSRFRFSIGGREKVAGREARVVEFKERAAPYLFGVEQVPTPVSGRFRIEPSTGVVLKSELLLVPNPARRLRSRAVLTVTFGQDLNVGVWVPREMTERYDGSTGSRFVTSISTYANYRQFGTSARIVQ